MSILDNIKKIAKKYGYSLTYINDKAGLGKNTIYSWKNKNPSTENLQKVADVLHISIEELIGKNNIEKKSSIKDITEEVNNPDENTFLSYKGMPIPAEELEMIRRILEGRKRNG